MGDVRPGRFGVGGKQLIDGGSLLFVVLTADRGADTFRRKIPGGAMQPTGQHRVLHEPGRISRERQENGLAHIPRSRCLPCHPEGGGMHEIDVPADQLSESCFRTAFSILSQQFLIRRVVHSSYNTRPNQSRTKKSGSAEPLTTAQSRTAGDIEAHQLHIARDQSALISTYSSYLPLSRP